MLDRQRQRGRPVICVREDVLGKRIVCDCGMSDVDEVGSGDKPMLCIPGAPYPAGESKPNIAAWNLSEQLTEKATGP
ncbi:hypothetical protein VM57_04145 [Stenotrophomonas maltophilia]|nr:hypothetical protein VM57_04145 [Stenotrophomonas maltophilia]